MGASCCTQPNPEIHDHDVSGIQKSQSRIEPAESELTSRFKLIKKTTIMKQIQVFEEDIKILEEDDDMSNLRAKEFELQEMKKKKKELQEELQKQNEKETRSTQNSIRIRDS